MNRGLQKKLLLSIISKPSVEPTRRSKKFGFRMSDQVAESASGSRKGSRGKGKGKRRSTGSESRGADSSNWRVREQPESGGADSSHWRAVREPEVEASAPAAGSQQGGEGDRRRQPGGKGKGKGKSKHKNKERNDGDEGSKDQSEDTKNPSKVRKERKAPELSRMQTPEYGSVTERLADQLSRGTYDCMICLNKVKPSHQIWPCDQCWAVFHLKCIKSWIQRCNSAGGLEFDWACPGCRYHRVDLMPKYSCYCKKLDEPELNPHWPPGKVSFSGRHALAKADHSVLRLLQISQQHIESQLERVKHERELWKEVVERRQQQPLQLALSMKEQTAAGPSQ
eukprot:s266_g4.t1